MIRGGIRRTFRLALRRRDRWEREVEDEIKLHLSLRAEQLMAQGAAPDDAYQEAVRRFGSLTESRARLLDAARHRERQMQRTEWASDIRQDLGFALRTLGRQKGWTAVTILTLALGIGSTTAVFSVVSSLLLHAVPYPAADRVMIVEQQPTTGNNTGIHVSITPSPRVVNAWRAGSHSFDVLEPYRSSTAALKTNGEPAPIGAAWILPSFTQFAAQKPLIGRLFSPEDMSSRAHVALLSEGMWRSRFGADTRVIGQVVTIDDSTYTVIGVMPATLRLPMLRFGVTDVWLPLDMSNLNLGLRVVGRLHAGTTPAVAMRELDELTRRAEASPGAAGTLNFKALVTSPAQQLSFHDSLILLTGAVALVLLVACANVAHLMLARAATRHRELAVRAALGAGRSRILRQLLTESLVLAFAGAVAGVAIGWIGLRLIVGARPAQLPELELARLDLTTLLVTAALATLSGIAFGVIGALQSSRHSTHDALKAGSGATSYSRRHDRLRSLLVISEMALSATLIVGATLLVRSVINMQHTDLGFEPQGLYAIDVNLPKTRYATPASRSAFMTELTGRLRTVPGIRDVALAAVAPSARSFNIGALEGEGEPATSASEGRAVVDANDVEPGWFKLMGVRMLEGSTFSDTSTAANQVIVNAGFARTHWPAGLRGALGHRVRVAYKGHGTWRTIVGVAADAAMSGPGSTLSAPILYDPVRDLQNGGVVMIRAQSSTDIVTPVRALIHSIDPQMAMPTIESAEHTISGSMAGPRFTMSLLTLFTMVALVLAAIGLYGVMAYAVTQRTREIGIRMALGASQRVIAKSVIVRGIVLALIGAMVGLVGAYWGTRLLTDMLFGVAALDVASFATGAAVLIVAAVVACVVPTRRALAVDPITAIRAD
jgi:putative ABC transport system permease protein